MKSDLFSKLNFWFSSCTSRGAMCDTSRSQITESECKTKKVKETSSLFFCQWLQQPKIRATYDSRIPGWAWIAIPRQWDPKNTIQGINQGGGGEEIMAWIDPLASRYLRYATQVHLWSWKPQSNSDAGLTNKLFCIWILKYQETLFSST